MFEIVKAGGIVMVPLILCSILAVAITLERLWTLRGQRVVPEELTDKVWRWVENRSLSDKQILALAAALAAWARARGGPLQPASRSRADDGSNRGCGPARRA